MLMSRLIDGSNRPANPLPVTWNSKDNPIPDRRTPKKKPTKGSSAVFCRLLSTVFLGFLLYWPKDKLALNEAAFEETVSTLFYETLVSIKGEYVCFLFKLFFGFFYGQVPPSPKWGVSADSDAGRSSDAGKTELVQCLRALHGHHFDL